jgi:hypothetical protein
MLEKTKRKYLSYTEIFSKWNKCYIYHKKNYQNAKARVVISAPVMATTNYIAEFRLTIFSMNVPILVKDF